MLRGRLQWLMGGRLVVATVLLGGTLLFNVGLQHGYQSFTPRFLLALIGLTYAASALFAVWLSRAPDLEPLAVTQVIWDLLVATGLVVISGGAGSVFSFLYGVIVLMAAIVVGPSASTVTAAASLLLYTTVGIGLANGWIPLPPDQPPTQYLLPVPDLSFAVMSNVVGLVLVALLARNLSGRLRRTGGQLRQAQRSAAALARLNDAIVRSISSGLVTTDLEGRVRTVNPAGAAMFGAHAEELVGTPVDKFLPTLETEAQQAPAPDSDQTAQGEGLASRIGGERFPVAYARSPLVEANGEITGVLITFQDLTEIHRLRDAAERAERFAALGRLAAGLAHEIRNPLSSISGSVQLVRDAEGLSDQDRRLLGLVLSEAERLEELVHTMLDIGHPSEPEPQRIDLGVTAGEVVQIARKGPAESAGVTLHYHVPDHPVTATLDPSQTRQLLWNLLKNAIQASPSGGTVDVQVTHDPTGQCVVAVSDEGEGVDEGEIEQLFDMFYSGRSHGVGLGLALVKQIVDRHGGRVDAENNSEGGASFRVTFPQAEQRNSSEAERPEVTPARG